MSCQIVNSCSAFSAVGGLRSKDELCKYMVFQTFHYVRENMQKDSNKSNGKEEVHKFDCECSDCQSKYGSLPLLIRVIEGRESNPGPSTSSEAPSSSKSIVCPHCNKPFTHRGDFNKHVRKHTGEQPYVCDICKRKFAHTSNLNRHIKVHTGDRPYSCDVCNKTFNRKDKLELHKKTKLCKKNAEKYNTS